eukprot:CAMPEP_0119318132 /NCGR_PEP_ID=MMETSP1333-20130426/45494_1 /TAXON_ID=418940 /ORGANISM="Scyphosphaera apsteinii, Strain RCC1455" /LENGTH=137 /DNA_ID=CAMNT_0007324257 /DNA_START=311 /DNA_END=720 /DNA_ORIENTATION=+
MPIPAFSSTASDGHALTLLRLACKFSPPLKLLTRHWLTYVGCVVRAALRKRTLAQLLILRTAWLFVRDIASGPNRWWPMWRSTKIFVTFVTLELVARVASARTTTAANATAATTIATTTSTATAATTATAASAAAAA